MSSPRTFSCTSTKTSMSAKRRTTALVKGSFRCWAMASASDRLALPASSFIPRAPFASLIKRSRPTCEALVNPSRLLASDCTAVNRFVRRQHDGGELAAIIGFSAMGGAAEAEEIGLPLIGAGGDDGNAPDRRSLQTRLCIRGKIETPMTIAVRGNEVLRVRGIVCKHACAKLVADFIGPLRDARPDRCRDPFAPRAELFHRIDRRFDDPRECALPARMRCADNSGLAVREKDRPAIGRENSKREAGNRRRHRIRLWSAAHVPRFAHLHGFSAVHLVKR